MKDIEKNSKNKDEELNKKDTEKVSGGSFVKQKDGSQGKVFCDLCGRSTGTHYGYYPVNGGHLCDVCLEKYKRKMKPL